MGSNLIRDLIDMDDLTRIQQIEIHLTGNFYPPVPVSMAQPCIEAIDAYWDGEYDKFITMPDGVFYKGMSHAPARAIIEQHRLQPWTSEESNLWD